VVGHYWSPRLPTPKVELEEPRVHSFGAGLQGLVELQGLVALLLAELGAVSGLRGQAGMVWRQEGAHSAEVRAELWLH